jgi:glucoamylase
MQTHTQIYMYIYILNNTTSQVWSYNNSISNALGLMKSYIGFVIHNQNEADPNNIDIRGEPKFLLPSGDVDPQPWCRPQNDGAAIRATTLALFANDLIDMGMSDYVAQYLWTGSSTLHGGAIKYDLDYVVSSWNANTCDLWEEVQSTDFFWDRFNQRRALLVGADFASRMGDSDSANTYQQAASTIGDLGHHFNGQYVFESTNRMQDSAVIAAFNVGYNFDGVYGPTDSRVAATISVLSAIFNQSYPINSADTNNGIPGILIGRYPGDTYGGGNPWVLLLAALV